MEAEIDEIKTNYIWMYVQSLDGYENKQRKDKTQLKRYTQKLEQELEEKKQC